VSSVDGALELLSMVLLSIPFVAWPRYRDERLVMAAV
jgi:hypothetical protein